MELHVLYTESAMYSGEWPSSVISTACVPSPLSSSTTPSLFHSRLKNYLFSNHFHHRLFSLSSDLTPCISVCFRYCWDFLCLSFLSLFSVTVYCGRLSWRLSAFERTINIPYLILPLQYVTQPTRSTQPGILLGSPNQVTAFIGQVKLGIWGR